MTEEELKQLYLKKFEEAFDENGNLKKNEDIIYVDDVEKEMKDLQKQLTANFKFDNATRKMLREEYPESEIRKAELQNQRVLQKMELKDKMQNNQYVEKSKTTFDFTRVDWEHLDEYYMQDMKELLGLNKKEAAIFDSIWTLHNTQYHIGKDKYGNSRIIPISIDTHYASYKSLKTNVQLVEDLSMSKFFTIEVSNSLMFEAYRILNDDEYRNKYDLDWIEKQKGISKRAKNSTKKIKDMRTGIVYDSASDCAKAIGKSNSYISKYRDRFREVN